LSCPGIRHSSSVHVTPRCRLFSPRHPRHEHGFTSNNSVTIFVQFELCNRTTLAVLLSLSPSSLSFSPPLKCLPSLLSLLSFSSPLHFTSIRRILFFTILCSSTYLVARAPILASLAFTTPMFISFPHPTIQPHFHSVQLGTIQPPPPLGPISLE
jgi:hypothetical protein